MLKKKKPEDVGNWNRGRNKFPFTSCMAKVDERTHTPKYYE